MNKVFLIGNLTRDPELSETAGGVPVCHFSISAFLTSSVESLLSK